MLDTVEKWRLWYEHLPKYLREKRANSYIPFYFLKQEIRVESDHYSGVDREYYYSGSDHSFHTCLYHWDGGNFTAEHHYDDEIIPVDRIISLLDTHRRITLDSQLSPQDVQIVEDTFALMKKWLYMLADGRIQESEP